jgi:hypothetical protein
MSMDKVDDESTRITSGRSSRSVDDCAFLYHPSVHSRKSDIGFDERFELDGTAIPFLCLLTVFICVPLLYPESFTWHSCVDFFANQVHSIVLVGARSYTTKNS